MFFLLYFMFWNPAIRLQHTIYQCDDDDDVCALSCWSDEYLGVWQWIKKSLCSHFERLKHAASNDPRVDVVLPRSVRHLGNWLSHGDAKVTAHLLLVYVLCYQN